MAMQEYKATVSETINASPRVKTLKIAVPEEFTFAPGQFVMVSIPGFEENGRQITRSYSIASSPWKKGSIELCVSLAPQGKMSARLHGLMKGDEIGVKGPYGTFRLKEPVQENTLFIGGGTGVAPLMSMLRTLYAEDFTEKLQLYYGVRSSQEILYKKELEAFAKEKEMNLVVSVSNGDENWNGERGYINDAVERKIRENGMPAYICGPPVMVNATVETLKRIGFESRNINREQW